MTNEPRPPSELLSEFGVTPVSFVEETGIAIIWKVRRSNGEFAALKSYKRPNMGNEGAGFDFLLSLDGKASALVFQQTKTCALIEWLDGPSLGDLSRNGEDERASAELVEVANKIHASHQSLDLPKLDTWFQALFSVEFAPDCPEAARQNILLCQDIARRLLSDQQHIRPLHGDLHHDNVRLGARGYCAFDAKGLLGERGYELANAFRNPKGVPELLRAPERIRYLRQHWSKQFRIDPNRLMQWVVAKAALSIAWRSSGKISADPEFDLLDIFLSELGD